MLLGGDMYRGIIVRNYIEAGLIDVTIEVNKKKQKHKYN